MGRPRLCFAVNEILPLLNYPESFRAYLYFARSNILKVALFCLLHFAMFSLIYDLSLEREKWFAVYDLSLKRKKKRFRVIDMMK